MTLKYTLKFPFLATCCLLLVSGFSFGQLHSDYEPMKQDGEVPHEYLVRFKEVTKLKYRNSLKMTKSDCNEFEGATQQTLGQMFQNGDIYFNDPMTEYVRNVGDKLLQGTNVAPDISFFVSRYPLPNATTWQDGTIILNIGLLARLENEAQLAFALAHEISHYMEQHPYRQYAEFAKNKSEGMSSSRAFISHSNRSLSYENEADSIAVLLLRRVGYDYQEGVRVLQIIKGEQEQEAVDVMYHFTTDKFEVTPKHLCKPLQYQDYMEEKAAIRPTDARQKRLMRTMTRSVIEPNLVKFQLDATLFEQVKNIAQFEQIEEMQVRSLFLQSTYEALLLLQKFPNNKYLHITVAENLFDIYEFHQLGIFNRLLDFQGKFREGAVADFSCFFTKLEKEEVKKMLLGIVLQQYRSYPSDPRMLIITAKTLETVYEGDYAKSYYEGYVKQFPDGEHAVMARERLEQMNGK
jgi:beta-barrel assembly-enhancing protease